MHLGLTKSRDDKLLQDLLDKKLRVIVIFEDDYLNHIARIAYNDTQQDNYTYRIGEYNIYKGEEWGFCDFCKRHDCYFIVPNETIEGGISEIPNDLGEAAEEWAENEAYGKSNAEFEMAYKGFIAGAKWQKEQMMKEAVEGEVTYDNLGYNNVVRAGVFNTDFEYGDKVHIIVCKKED